MRPDDPHRLTYDAVDRLLPELDELRPLRARLLAEARPEAGRRWSGSGLLDTAGRWRTDPAGLLGGVEALAADEARHTAEVWRCVAEALCRAEAADPAGAARRFLDAAALEEGRDRAGPAAAYADAAVRALEADPIPDPLVRSRALRRRARARRALARHEEALTDYEAAGAVSRAAGDVQGGAEAAVGAGNVMEDQGRWAEAEVWYRRALALLDAEGAEGPRPERMHALFNLHVVLRSRGDVAASVPLLEEARRVAGALGDDTARPFLDNALGQLLMARGEGGGAGRHFRDALAMAEGARARVTIRLNLAETLLAEGRSLDAAEEARRAEAEAITGHVHDRLPEAYRLLGRVAAAEANPDAFVLFERALALVDRTGLPDVERARTLQAYAEAMERLGDDDRAGSLRQASEAAYRELGIEYPRSAWVDRHGPDDTASRPQDHHPPENPDTRESDET